MKSLPEQEMLNRLENRLRDYAEQPDDDLWDTIAAALPKPVIPAWTSWSVYAGVAAATVASLVLVLSSGIDRQSNSIQIYAKDKNSSHEITDSIQWLSRAAVDMKIQNKNSMLNREERESMQRGEGRVKRLQVRHEDQGQSLVYEKNEAIKHPDDVVSSVGNDGDQVSRHLKISALEKTAPEPKAVENDSSHIASVKKDSVNTGDGENVNQKRQRQRKPVSVYAAVTPSLSYWQVTPAGNDDRIVQDLASPGIIATERLGFSIAAGVQGQVTRRLEYFAGLSIYYQNQILSYAQVSGKSVAVKNANDMSFEIIPKKEQAQLSYKMLNAGAQAGVFYLLKDSRLQHKIGAGLSYQQGLLRAAHTEQPAYTNASSYYASWQLFYRLEYPATPALKVFFQPSYSHAFYQHEKLQVPFSVRTARAEFSIGVTYRLHR
jgi:predicted DNA-binding protein YlxM (UPF0122 family)